MKTIITALSLLAVPALTSAAVNPAAVMDDMAPYVYPQNAAPTPSKPLFMPDGLSYLEISDDGRRIVSRDVATGKEKETVMDMATTRENKLPGVIEEFALSPDGSRLLVATGKNMIYRHSYAARYYVYEIRTRLLHPLSETPGHPARPALLARRQDSGLRGRGQQHIPQEDRL